MEKTTRKLLSSELTKVIYQTLSSADLYAAKKFQESIKAASKVIAKDFLKTCEELNKKTKDQATKPKATSAK